MKAKILIIEDDTSLASSLKRVLQFEDYDVVTAPTAEEGFTAGTAEPFDLVLTDLQLAGPKGVETTAGLTLIRGLHATQPHLPVVLMTAHHTTEIAIEATKLGAYDYILKPFETQALVDLVARAVESKRLMSEPVELGTGTPTVESIVGNSRPMQTVYKEIGRVAAKPVTVLIRGETGTGKELVARAIYQHSDRSQKPFIIVNCVAIPETLLESELFGHEQGAFTGAHVRRIGRFEQANGGTIFLDEIGDMSMSTQAKLLRVLQDRSIQRLGGKETIHVDVRVLAATHRDLETAIREKQFREDLYYRLNDATITVPPLRDRREDITPLVDYFLQRYSAEFGHTTPNIAADAREFLRQQQWAGNVRELENVVRKTLLSAHGFAISTDTVKAALETTRLLDPASNQPLTGFIRDLLEAAQRGKMENVSGALIETAERELYAQAIKLAAGNQARAAKWLGVSRPTMREKLKRYGLRSIPESGTAGLDI